MNAIDGDIASTYPARSTYPAKSTYPARECFRVTRNIFIAIAVPEAYKNQGVNECLVR